jgi:hypothetical protein
MIASQRNDLPFDIFQLEAGGRVLWLEAAANLEHAHLRVHELSKSRPAEFIIVNLETGDKLIMNRNTQNGVTSRHSVDDPAWKETYLGALHEDDPAKLLDKVLAAETAIVERLRALRISPEAITNADAEQVELAEAARVLLSVKNNKLNFPDWMPSPEAEAGARP